MADFLFNYAAGPLEYGSASLAEQARALLRERIWGLPDGRPRPKYSLRIARGDRVIAYVGGDERVFVGDAVVTEGYHAFTSAEATLHAGNLGDRLCLVTGAPLNDRRLLMAHDRIEGDDLRSFHERAWRQRPTRQALIELPVSVG